VAVQLDSHLLFYIDFFGFSDKFYLRCSMSKGKRNRARKANSEQSREGICVTEFFLDDHLDPVEFELTFGVCFPGSQAKILNVPRDAKPGYLIYNLEMPMARKEELQPFLNEYARTHNADNKQHESSSFPFNSRA
jgi:hypothetical protein